MERERKTAVTDYFRQTLARGTSGMKVNTCAYSELSYRVKLLRNHEVSARRTHLSEKSATWTRSFREISGTEPAGTCLCARPEHAHRAQTSTDLLAARSALAPSESRRDVGGKDRKS